MFQTIFSKISELIVVYGSWGVFLISLLEEIVLPVPATLTLMATGSILLHSYKSFGEVIFPAIFFIAMPAALGVAIGGLVIYVLAYWGGRVVIDRWGRWFDFSEEKIEKLKRYFELGYGDELVLFGLRATPIFPNSLVSAVCGFIRYPIKPFLILSFLGGIPRALLMALVGWWAGEAYAQYVDPFSGAERYILGISLVLVLGFLLFLVVKARRNKVNNENS